MSLNFIMEDYSTGILDNINEVKENIWKSKYVFKKVYNKVYFEPLIEELGGSTELYELFLQYSDIPVINVKSSYSDDNMNCYDFIKIHINNTWAYVCEKDCYLPKEYYKRIHYPKNLYFEIVKSNNFNYGDIKAKLEDNKLEYDKIKSFANNRKMDIDWDEFRNRVDKYLDRISLNFKPVDVYEDENPENDIDFETIIGYTDDNYAVSYINKSLTGYFRKEYIKNMGLPTGNDYEFKECCNCGKLILKEYKSKRKYCNECSIKVNLIKDRENKRIKYNSRIYEKLTTVEI